MSFRRRQNQRIMGSTRAKTVHRNQDGNFHCLTGPAYIEKLGYKEWWVDGWQVNSNKAYQKATNMSDEDMIVMILKYGNVI